MWLIAKIAQLALALSFFAGLAFAAPEKAAPEKHPGMRLLAKEAAQGDAKREADYLALLEKAVYQQSIIDAISRPAEGKAWKDYRPIFLTQARIDAGVAFWREHAAEIRYAQKKYQVPASYIVAIIGVETFYGRNVGKYRVLDALTTLGLYYPPRQAFFAGELTQFLRFSEVDTIKLDPEKTLGSYAGAMGLGQFIPTSYLKFSADGDGDGLVDLWGSQADATASVARYFNLHGWTLGAPVIVRAEVRADAKAVADTGVLPQTTVAALAKLGYVSKVKVPGETPASLLVFEGPDGPEHYISFQNFYVITRYNRSPLYALAVHQLSVELDRAHKAARKAERKAVARH